MRRTARECAVQFLYQLDLHRPPAVDRALAGFWTFMDAATGVKIEAATRVFGDSLINGTIEKMPEVDAKLKSLADNWELERLAAVDRNILRLAIYEMLFREEIPPIVSINEAIEIAKRFSTEDSGRFVNGVLDRLRKELLRPARHASSPGPT